MFKLLLSIKCNTVAKQFGNQLHELQILSDLNSNEVQKFNNFLLYILGVFCVYVALYQVALGITKNHNHNYHLLVWHWAKYAY